MKRHIQYKMKQKRQQYWRRVAVLAVLLVAAIVPARATDHVFSYNGGYLSVNGSGQVAYTTTFSRSCIWTCVSNTSTLAAATLDGSTSRFLYTEVNGTRYWMSGSTTNGTALSVTTTAPGTAYWQYYNNGLDYYRNRNYYVYYRGNTWRTSGSTGNDDNYYAGSGYNATDYRATVNAGSAGSATSSTATSIDGLTITPSMATLSSGQNQSFTASATVTQTTYNTPAHTVFTLSGTTYYFYNGTVYTSKDDFSTSTTNTYPPSYAWVTASGDSKYAAWTTTYGENIYPIFNTSAKGKGKARRQRR